MEARYEARNLRDAETFLVNPDEVEKPKRDRSNDDDFQDNE
jgi:hypothetical protein